MKWLTHKIRLLTLWMDTVAAKIERKNAARRAKGYLFP
jgi:hypothetical protein